MIRRVLLACVCAVLLGCSMPLINPRPDGAVALSRQDWRQDLVGEWNAEFFIDSMIPLHSGDSILPRRWRSPLDLASIRGILVLVDTLIGSSPGRGLRARFALDFRPALGRQISCLRDSGRLAAGRTGTRTVRLEFTPGVYDCGFAGVGQVTRDSIVGTWSESSFVGPVSEGRFRLIRTARTQ